MSKTATLARICPNVLFEWGDTLPKWEHMNIRAMIGEAVPPLFTRKHGQVLTSLLNGVHPRGALDLGDARLTLPSASLERARQRNEFHEHR